MVPPDRRPWEIVYPHIQRWFNAGCFQAIGFAASARCCASRPGWADRATAASLDSPPVQATAAAGPWPTSMSQRKNMLEGACGCLCLYPTRGINVETWVSISVVLLSRSGKGWEYVKVTAVVIFITARRTRRGREAGKWPADEIQQQSRLHPIPKPRLRRH